MLGEAGLRRRRTWTHFNNIQHIHEDVIQWKHFPRYRPFVRGIHRSPVNSPHKGHLRGALMFSLIYARINCWINNGKVGDLRRNRAHYDVTVMFGWYYIRAAWSILVQIKASHLFGAKQTWWVDSTTNVRDWTTWWRHQMETFSALLVLCAGNSPITGDFPSQRPVTRSFDVFFDLLLNKRLSKQSCDWWFEAPSLLSWRHCNARVGWFMGQ